ncbi:MAG: carboxypeptidase-like regulatory domain-containing protein [bacterium]
MTPHRPLGIFVRRTLALVLLTAATAATARAQFATRARAIIVSDSASGLPIAGAEVRDSLTGGRALTGEDGRASLFGMMPTNAHYVFEVRKLGYQPRRLRIPAASLKDDQTPIRAVISPRGGNIVELDAVVTTAPEIRKTNGYVQRGSRDMQGFEDRRHSVALRGKFLTPEELREKYTNMDIREALRLSGLVPISRSCRAAYFVNGVAAIDLPTNTDSYEAIEFYPSVLQAPVEIIGSLAFDAGRCGVYVMWLRGS